MAEQYLSDVHVYTAFHQPIGDEFAYTRFEFRTSHQPRCCLQNPDTSERPQLKHLKHQRTLSVDKTISQTLSSLSQSVSGSAVELVHKRTNESVDTETEPSKDNDRNCFQNCDKGISTYPSSVHCETLAENVAIDSMKFCQRVVKYDLTVDSNVDGGGSDAGGGDGVQIPVDSNVDGGGSDAGGGDGVLDGKVDGQGWDESDNGSGGGRAFNAAATAAVYDAAGDSGEDYGGNQEIIAENNTDLRENSAIKNTNVTKHYTELFSDDDEAAHGVDNQHNDDDDNEEEGDDDDGASEGLESDDSENGDQRVRRKRRRRLENIFHITIKHRLSTSLADVGMQVWMGALFLADYILHSPEILRSQRVLDLGAGSGLTSIVAGLFAREVYCTDVGDMILSLACDNVARAMAYRTLPFNLCPVRVRELDWFSGLKEGNETGEFSLTTDDILAIQQADLILAADVVYDCNMIDVLFRMIRHLCAVPRDGNRKFLFSLEKRFVFTIEDLEITSPAYNYFRSKLTALETEEGDVRVKVAQLSNDFPKYFRYERPRHLELWEITTRRIDSME